MPLDLSIGERVRIDTDPKLWPPQTYKHIMKLDKPHEQPPPTGFLDAVIKWGQEKRPRVGTGEDWWVPLSEYGAGLKGWALTGHGNLPTTSLSSKEIYRRGRKLASWEIDEIAAGALDDHPEW